MLAVDVLQTQDPMAIINFCKMSPPKGPLDKEEPRKICHLVWVKEDAAPKCNEAPPPPAKPAAT